MMAVDQEVVILVVKVDVLEMSVHCHQVASLQSTPTVHQVDVVVVAQMELVVEVVHDLDYLTDGAIHCLEVSKGIFANCPWMLQ